MKRPHLPRRGFSLAEVLVMVIVASSCMVPIIGILGHGLDQGKSFELKRAMRNVAESKMNDIMYRGFLEGVMPETVVTTVNYPNDTDPECQFTVSVEVISPLNVTTNPAISGLTGGQDPKLLGVSVKVTVAAPGPDVGEVSLFTMFDKPRQVPDMLYVSCPDDRTIYEVHPINHVETDNLILGSTYVPYQVAVHPNGEWLAIKALTNTGVTTGRILLMDLRRASSKRGKAVSVTNDISNLFGSTTGATAVPTNPPTGGYRATGGLAFRPDGKVLYYTYWNTSNSEYRVNALTVGTLPTPGNLPSGTWSGNDIDLPNFGNVMSFRMGQDGYLYLVQAGNTSAPIVRINTETRAVETLNPSWQYCAADNVRAFAPSWDGNELAFWMDGEGALKGELGFMLSGPTTAYKDFGVTQLTMGLADGVNDLLPSRDNRWYILPMHHNNSGSSKERIGLIRRSLEGTWDSPDFDLTDTNNVKAYSSQDDKMYQLRQSSNPREIIIEKFGETTIQFFKLKDLLSGTFSPTTFTPSGNQSISDVTGRTPEILWVGVTKPTAPAGKKHYLINFDLEGGASRGRYTDDSMVPLLNDAPRFCALDGGGAYAYLAIANRQVPERLNVMTNNVDTPPYSDDEWPDFSGSGDNTLCYPHKGAWLLDNSLLLLVEKPGDNSSTGQTPSAVNGFRLFKSGTDGKITRTAALGWNFNYQTEGWRVKDVAAMHTRNGAYVLIGKSATTPSDASILLWIEKSKSRGLTGTELTLEYKIMAAWDSRYDGFPTRCPWTMSLSPDDSLLAFYCPIGNGSKGSVVVWDMRNLHFPAQPGLICQAYAQDPAAGSGDFGAPPVLANVNPKVDCLTNFMTTGYNPQNDYPVYVWKDNNPGFTWTRATRFSGYWYTSGLKSLGNLSEYCSRWFLDGADQGNPAYGGNWANWPGENGGVSYAAWNVSPSDSCHNFQLESFSRNTCGWNNMFINKSSANSTGAPTGPTFSGTPPTWPTLPTPARPATPALTGGNTAWAPIPASEFRAFRFRPPVVADITLNGNWRGTGDVPDVDSRTDGVVTSDSDKEDAICWHRDRDRAILFYMHDTDEKVYGINLFDAGGNFTPLDMGSIIGNSADPTDIGVSPDGRRLIVNVPKETSGYGLYLADINSTSFSNAKKYSLPSGYKPSTFGVRPFNSFSSGQGTFNDQGVVLSNLCGNQRAVMTDGGIVLAGGAAGVDQTAVTTVQKYDASRHGATPVSNLTALGTAVRNAAAFINDGSVFSVGGENTTPTVQSAVNCLSGGTYKNLQNNDNTDYPISQAGACATPYGPVLAGGRKTVTNPFIDAGGDMTTLSGKISQNKGSGDPTEAIFSGTTFQLAAGSGHYGSAFLNDSFTLTANTNIFTHFVTKSNQKDGIVFVIQKIGSTACGNSNAGMGWNGGTFSATANGSIGVVMDLKANGTPNNKAGTIGICVDGGLTSTCSIGQYCDSAPVGPTGVYYDTGGTQTNHWWVIYDSQRKVFDVWVNTTVNTSNPEAATRIIKDYSFDLFAKFGSQVWIGFTGASNDSAGFHQITDWQLKVWNTPNFTTTSFPNFSSTTGLGPLNGDNISIGSNILKLCTSASSGDHYGSCYLNNSIAISDETSFQTKFNFYMYDSDSTNGEGFAFVAQGVGNTAVGGSGQKLAYDFTANTMAVEFDAYGENNTNDPNPNIGKHVCVTAGGASNIKWPTAFTYNYNTDYWAWIDYDAVSRNLRVFWSTTSTKPANPNINGILGASIHDKTNGSSCLTDNVWFGFTASNGGNNNAWTGHWIKSWDFSIGDIGGIQVLSKAVKVYYPQCFDSAASKWGETLAMADLDTPLQDGCAVSHYSRKDRKWYLYFIGGGTGAGAADGKLIREYNFDGGSWTPIDLGDDEDTERTGCAACSWGDEIFIFGGARTGGVKNKAMAWNPDTRKVRHYSTLYSTGYCFQSAVPLGPYIYLLGGTTSLTGANASGRVLRFKP